MQYLVRMNNVGSETWTVICNSHDKKTSLVCFGQTVNKMTTKYGSPSKTSGDWLNQAHYSAEWNGKCEVVFQALHDSKYSSDTLMKIDYMIKGIARTHYKCKNMPLVVGKARTVQNVLRLYYNYEVPIKYVWDVLKVVKGAKMISEMEYN